MSYNIIDDGHVSSPLGFRATGISGGLKDVRARDLALVYSQPPCRAAAVFTTSAVLGAPIFFNQAILARNRDKVHAVLINAGQANAGTGQPGLADAVECAKLTADELEVPRDSVLLLSTGQIGVPLPMQKMKGAIRRAVSELDSGGGRRAAIAILTSDTKPKDRALSVSFRDGRNVTIGGMAKGSRLVHPRLATLLCVLTSDIAMDARLLARSLEQSVGQSFGRLTIDGDTSPNDGVILLANGAADRPPITNATSWEYGAWQEALDVLCADLAQQVVRDAAAKGKLIQVHVRGAASEGAARQVAQSIARSASVRWACAHNSPDWGGMLISVGSSGVELRPDLLELRIGPVAVMLDGMPAAFDQASAVQVISGPEVELIADLHMGASSATVWTCTTPND